MWKRSSEENLPDRRRPALEALQAKNLKVAKAWAVKESFRQLWSYRSAGWTVEGSTYTHTKSGWTLFFQAPPRGRAPRRQQIDEERACEKVDL